MFIFLIYFMSCRSIALCRYYNLMKMGKKNKVMLHLMMAGMRRDLKYMVAIKEIKVPNTKNSTVLVFI